MDDALSVAEAAEVLNVSPQAVRDMIRRGDLVPAGMVPRGQRQEARLKREDVETLKQKRRGALA